jgi:TolB protein
VNADGSEARKLTRGDGRTIDDFDPKWSPDGRQIVFTRTGPGYLGCGIPCYDNYVMHADGTSLKVLPGGTLSKDCCPVWSPNGSHIASFTWEGGIFRGAPGIWDTQVSTSRTRPLLTLEFSPQTTPSLAWSPDGKWLCASFDAQSGLAGVYRVRATGRGVFRLASMASSSCDWSPDSGRIVFSNGLGNIFSIAVNGHSQTRLTRATADETSPQWSPDGKAILFLRQETDPGNAPYDLWKLETDGSGQTIVAKNVSAASWSADGRLIAFIRGGLPGEFYPHPQGLWLSKPDGSDQLLLAKGAADFDWQRLP